MLVLGGNYRAPLIFNDETQDAAEKSLERLKSAFRPAPASAKGLSPETASALANQTETTQQSFVDAMDDDFNTPLVLAALYELVKGINTARDNGATDEQLQPAQSTLRELTSVLGLRLQEKQGAGHADKFIDLLVEVRSEVRKQKLWQLSDLIRDKLKELGVVLEDSKEGTIWRWG
jgi:cysteinyl-tRNA synthetase